MLLQRPQRVAGPVCMQKVREFGGLECIEGRGLALACFAAARLKNRGRRVGHAPYACRPCACRCVACMHVRALSLESRGAGLGGSSLGTRSRRRLIPVHA